MSSNAKRQKIRWLTDSAIIAHAVVVKNGVPSRTTVCGLPTPPGGVSVGATECASCRHSISHNVLVGWVPPEKRRG